ncbi:unnamed protein product, partial [Symbiodinium sp. KB8]
DAPSQFQPVLTMVGRACESIASSKKLEADTRRLGMELMLTLSETAGTMVRKCKPMVHTMIKLAFTMMEEAPEDPAWHTYEYCKFGKGDVEQPEEDSCAGMGEQ